MPRTNQNVKCCSRRWRALGPDDVLVLDRGYPAAWLVAYLTEHKIRFCMRCDKANGWVAMRAFMHSGQQEARVTLNKLKRQDVFAKVLADNLGSLVCQAASEEAQVPQRQRNCNRAYARARDAKNASPHGAGHGLYLCPAQKKRSDCLAPTLIGASPIALDLVQNITSNRIPAWLTRGEA